MDKRVILAVAGSGKTYHLVERLNDKEKFLLLTYTNSNTENLRICIIKKFGFFPKNIKLKSYFNFLYSFCYKPFLANVINTKGIYWKYPFGFTRNLRRDNKKFYILKDKWLYHNRIAKLIIEKNLIPEVNKRLEKYYDYLLIDEVQDLGGNDFNFVMELLKAQVNVILVGDFYQHTFATSNDGNVNVNLYKHYADYKKRFEKIGVSVETDKLVKSRRCSKTVCDFIRDKIGIEIFSAADSITQIKLVTSDSVADEIFKDKHIVKLFLQQHYSYDCFSDNWGNCKGLEFENVCVVLNDDTLKLYKKNKLSTMNQITKNKFYVACTRTRGNLFFVPQNLYTKYKKNSA